MLGVLSQVGVVADALTLTGSIHDYPVVPECDLNVNLNKLLETGNLSDVTLTTGDKEFKAHKAILAGTVLVVLAVVSVCRFVCLFSSFHFCLLVGLSYRLVEFCC